jgi:multisubunit Na+/H+ antiporter MnhF subunit
MNLNLMDPKLIVLAGAAILVIVVLASMYVLLLGASMADRVIAYSKTRATTSWAFKTDSRLIS